MQISTELVIREGRRGVGRQVQGRPLVRVEAPERQREADEDRAGHARAATFEHIGDTRRTRHAVALTGENKWRIVGIEAVAIDADELRHRFRIAARLVELWSVFGFDRAAVTRANGIDEDEIGEIQPGAVIVDWVDLR